jgi:Holliday junction resolvasome RuvABC endonuclease subunit
MSKKPITILAINPGTKYMAIAIFRESELREWFIKIFKGKWSKEKRHTILAAIETLMDRYQVTVLAIKRLHPSRSSRNLNSLVSGIKREMDRRGLKVHEYSITQMERSFCTEGKVNRKNMAEQVVRDYPGLFNEFEKEKQHKNPYWARLFEAVALGSICHDELDKA